MKNENQEKGAIENVNTLTKDMENVENSSSNKQTEGTQRKRKAQLKNKKKITKYVIITAIIIAIVAIIIISFGIFNKINTKVYANIYLNDMNVSGKTEVEVLDIIKETSKKLDEMSLKIIQGENVILEVNAKDFDLYVDEQATLNNVMLYGRDGNIFSNNFNVLKALAMKKNIDLVYNYSDTKLVTLLGEINTNIEGKVVDDAFQLDEKEHKLVITKGKAGLDINVEEFKTDIINKFKNETIDSYEIKTFLREANELDVDVVYSQIAREAKNASIDDSVKPIVYSKHEVGLDFNKDKLREVLAKEENKKEGKVIKFDLTIREPKIKLSDIKTNLYEDKLSSYTSSFASSDANRASNLRLSISMINGTLVMPGEVFSFNSVMGDCGLSSRGFKPAAVFKSGKIVKEVGGGICQLSSSLYNAVLYANLEIVARSNHALPVGYVPPSRDATIYYPYLDFKFKNNRNYPIKIVATHTSAKKMTIAIYGTFEEVEYEVELTSMITSTILPKTTYENDPNLEEGKQKTIKHGVNGYRSVAYKKVKLNGKVISNELLSEDSYKAMNKIVAVGAKVVNTQPTTPEPEPPQEPSTPPPAEPPPNTEEPEITPPQE